MIGPFGGGGGGDSHGPMSGLSSSSDDDSGIGPFSGDSDESELVQELKSDFSHAKFQQAKSKADSVTGTTISDRFAGAITTDIVPELHHRVVLPNRNDGGVESAVTLFERFHRPGGLLSTLNPTSTPATHAIEYHFDSDTGEITTHLLFGSDHAMTTFDDLAFEMYPNSSIEHTGQRHPESMFNAGRGIAAATYSTIRQDRWPIRQATDTEKAGYEPSMRIGTDPLATLFGAMARNRDTSIIVQVAGQPTELNALVRRQIIKQADRIDDHGDDAENGPASALRRKANRQLYRVAIRVIATTDPDGRSVTTSPANTAATAVTAVSNALDAFDHRNQTVKQGFGTHPVSGLTETTMRRSLKSFTRNTLSVASPKKTNHTSKLTIAALSGIGHVPGDLDTRRLSRSTVPAGNPVPSSLPRFPWEQTGIDPTTATVDEKAQAVYLNQHLSEDLFYGVCVRDGIEVAVPWLPTDEKAHTITSGQSGKGKTSTLSAKQFQLASKGRSPLEPIADRTHEQAVIDCCQSIGDDEDIDAELNELATSPPDSEYTTIQYDPKGKDTGESLAAHPGSPDETVIWTIGGDNPNGFEVGINPLQIPLDVDPSSREFTELLEPRVEAMKALMALMGGGPDEVLYSRMDRITDLASRALSLGAKQGYQPSVSDFAGALLGEEKREQLAADASEEREEFVGELASVALESLNDSDIEPTLGRLTGIMISPVKLANIGRPESTFSPHEMIANGWDMFIEDKSVDTRLGQASAAELLILVWMAVRELAADPNRPDPKPVEFIIDESPVVISKHSDLADILGQARAYDLHVDLAGQDFGNQLPDTIEGLARSQTDRAISFNAGTEDESPIADQHTDDVSIENLTDIPNYQAYIRTTTQSGDLSPSLRTRMFNKPVEILPEEYIRTDEQVQAFREASYRIHGAPELTTKEIRKHSRYFDSVADVDSDPETTDGTDLSPTDRKQLVKAVYDTAYAPGTTTDPASITEAGLEQDTDGGSPFVTLDAARTFRGWTLPDHVATATTPTMAAWIERLHDEGDIEWRETDHGNEVRCTGKGTGLFRPGAGGQTEGGLGHRALLRDHYGPLTASGPNEGVDVELVDQDGSTAADAVWRLPPEFDLPDDASFDDIVSHRDALEAEYPFLMATTRGETTLIEAEKSTSGSPYQTCTNLAGAVNQGHRCVFIVRPEKARTVHRTLSDPPYCREGPTGSPRFYCGDALRIDGRTMLRPADSGRSTVWLRTDHGEFVLADGDGNSIVTFPDIRSIFEDTSRYPNSTDAQTATAATDVDGDEWKTVTKPFIPDREFTTVPDSDQWSIVTVSKGTTRPDDLDIYQPDTASSSTSEQTSPTPDGDTRTETESTGGGPESAVDSFLERY